MSNGVASKIDCEGINRTLELIKIKQHTFHALDHPFVIQIELGTYGGLRCWVVSGRRFGVSSKVSGGISDEFSGMKGGWQWS